MNKTKFWTSLILAILAIGAAWFTYPRHPHGIERLTRIASGHPYDWGDYAWVTSDTVLLWESSASREMLLTIPPKRSDISWPDYLKRHREIYPKGNVSEAEVRHAYNAGMILPEKASPRMVRAQMTGDVYKSPHWDEPNVLAHR